MSQFSNIDLMAAIMKSDFHGVEQILNTANVNTSDSYDTPLTLAVQKDQIDIVNLLFIQYS